MTKSADVTLEPVADVESNSSPAEEPGAPWMTWILFACLSSLGYMLIFERPLFDQVLHLDFWSLLSAERLTIYWLIWAKTLSLLILFTIAFGILFQLGLRRTSWIGFAVCSTIMYFAMFADLRIYKAFGVHVFSYLEFVSERAAMDAGGGRTSWGPPAFMLFACVTFCTIALLAICAFAGPWLLHRLGGKPWESVWRRVALYSILFFSLTPYFISEALPSLVFEHRVDRLFKVAVVDLRTLYRAPKRYWWMEGLHPQLAKLSEDLDRRFKGLAATSALLKPVDETVRIKTKTKPHVVIVVLESLRFDVLERGQMPRLRELSKRGLQLTRHYSNSSRTETGLFAMTYGRYPAVYPDYVSDESPIQPAQMLVTFGNSGYTTNFVSAHDELWLGLEKFLSSATADRASYFSEDENWPNRDHTVIQELKTILDKAEGQPQWILGFLMSTHFEYQYPPEYLKHKPVDESVKWRVAMGDAKMEEVYNRYKNAVLFSDDLVADFIESLDLENTIVIVTGDHGESFKEDGQFGHVFGLSDYQSRVPMIILGAGVEPGEFDKISQHVDILPTLLHLIEGTDIEQIPYGHGHDLLSQTPSPNSAVLANGRRPRDEVIFVRGEEFLKTTIYWTSDRIRVHGFLDGAGTDVARDNLTDDEVQEWVEHVSREIHRFHN